MFSEIVLTLDFSRFIKDIDVLGCLVLSQGCARCLAKYEHIKSLLLLMQQTLFLLICSHPK